jgi:hypothetical protein
LKTSGKLNHSFLFLGIWLGLAILAAVPGYARSTTGNNAFKVMWPGKAYSCLKESYGAVVNNCTYKVAMSFDMPIDSTGWKGIDIVDYPNGNGSFSCEADTYDPYGNDVDETPQQTFNATGQQTLHFSVLAGAGDSITVICWDVAPSRGITSLNWTP